MSSGTFNGSGSDADGSSGDADRVLTLANTGLTSQNGFLVYVSGLALALTTEYTVTHNDTATEITFVNRLWDDMTIVVNYEEKAVSGLGGDFALGPFADFGVTATRTPVTVTTNYSGNKTYTDGVDESIEIVLIPYNVKYDLDKSGLNKSYDMMAFVGPSETLNNLVPLKSLTLTESTL